MRNAKKKKPWLVIRHLEYAHQLELSEPYENEQSEQWKQQTFEITKAFDDIFSDLPRIK